MLPPVAVVGSTPYGSAGLPLAKTPGNAQSLGAADISEQHPATIADLLNDNVGSVSVSNGTGNPYQNDLNYRGFQASSVLGAPVSLSAYFDGVRMNEPFSSLVNWDLIPMNAIARTLLIPGSNPIFGLNTLGGSLVQETKNGADYPGSSFTVGTGTFGRRALAFESGGTQNERLDYFVAGNIDAQKGYRLHSRTDVRQLFGKVRWHDDAARSELALSLTLADNCQGQSNFPQVWQFKFPRPVGNLRRRVTGSIRP